MVSGQKTLHAIDSAIVRSRNEVAKASTLPAKLAGQLMALQSQESAALARISRLRLDLIAAGEDEQSLGYVDRQASKLLAAHERSERRLSIKAEQLEAKIAELESQRRAQEGQVADAIKEYEKKAAACQAKLLKDPDYITAMTASEELADMCARVELKLDVAFADEQEKGRAFREDPFFSYLDNRNYGRKDAKGWGLTNWLDGWIARLCDYRTARMNYDRLRAIPERLQAHLDSLAQQQERAVSQVELSEKQMLEREGVNQARQQSLKEQSRLEKIDAKIAETEDKHLAVREEQSLLTAGKAGPYAKAVALISETLKSRDLQSLGQLAMQSTSQDDDQAVRDLAQLREEMSQLDDHQREASKLLKQQRKSLEELEKVRRKFKHNRYDAPFSRFSSKDLIATLLKQAMIGALSGDDLWSQIRRAQRTVQRNTDIDFGGIDWGEAMRYPRNSGGWGITIGNGSRGRSSRNRRASGGWGGSSGGSRRRAPRINFPKSSGSRRGGGFRRAVAFARAVAFKQKSSPNLLRLGCFRTYELSNIPSHNIWYIAII